MQVKCLVDQRVSTSAAWPLVVEGCNSLFDQGFAHERGAFPVRADDHCILAYSADDGDIVGAITYHCDTDRGEYVVTSGYVEPTSRRLGVFRAMWQTLAAAARQAGVSFLRCEIHVDDGTLQTVMAKLGGQPQFTTWEFKVKS